jgi:2-alkenal reductase
VKLKQLLSKQFVILVAVLLLAACGPANDAAQSTIANLAENGQQTESAQESNPVNVSAPVNTQVQVPDTAVAANDDIVTQQTYISLYERVNPAVVNIQVLGSSEPIVFEGEELPEDLPEGHPDVNPDEEEEMPFEFPFELPDGFTIPENPDDFQMPSGGQGSGFVYDAAGHIITNNHVVQGAEKITVFFPDGTETSATIVGTDPASDIAVIKVDPAVVELHPVVLGDSDSLKVGQLVAAIGNPLGLDGSMSTGIISGLGRLLPGGAAAPNGQRFNIPNIIQTDTAINPGNSGGPLLNLRGEVIGVNTAIETSNPFGMTPSFGGIGYVVPSNIVQRVVPQLIENGEIAHPWLGVAGGDLTGVLAEAMGLDINQDGVIVSDVVPNGPAAKAGLQGSDEEVTIDGFPAVVGGDIIIQINDQPVTEFDDLLGYLVTQTAVNDTVTLTILRDGETMTVEVTLEARP